MLLRPRGGVPLRSLPRKGIPLGMDHQKFKSFRILRNRVGVDGTPFPFLRLNIFCLVLIDRKAAFMGSRDTCWYQRAATAPFDLPSSSPTIIKH